jgi:hypothetical protein
MRGRTLAAFNRVLLRAAVTGAACSVIGACGVSQLTSPFKGGLFGGSKEETVASAPQAATQQQGVNQANLLTAAQTGTNDAGALTAASIGCPNLDISSGDRSVTFSAPGTAGDPLGVMHRGEITNSARECAPRPSGLTVKYGFSGRVLLGPKGKAGTLSLPAKLTVVDGSRATVKTEKIRVVVNVPAGSTAGYFSEVREVVLPIEANDPAKKYRIYVGFDQSAVGSK